MIKLLNQEISGYAVSGKWCLKQTTATASREGILGASTARGAAVGVGKGGSESTPSEERCFLKNRHHNTIHFLRC